MRQIILKLLRKYYDLGRTTYSVTVAPDGSKFTTLRRTSQAYEVMNETKDGYDDEAAWKITEAEKDYLAEQIYSITNVLLFGREDVKDAVGNRKRYIKDMHEKMSWSLLHLKALGVISANEVFNMVNVVTPDGTDIGSGRIMDSEKEGDDQVG